MHTTKWQGLKIFIGTICLLSVLISLFFVPGWGGYRNRILSYGFDLGHYPLFALITAALLVARRNKAVKPNVAFVLLAALFIAVSVELIQPYFQRTASVFDVLLGMAGSVSVVCVYLAVAAYSARAKWFLYCLAVISFLCAATPLFLVTLDTYRVYKIFPLVDSFEQPVELGRWKPEGCTLNHVEEHATHGRYALKIRINENSGEYPGIFYRGGIMDWSNYGRLALDAFLDNKKSKYLWIRADERNNASYADRSQAVVELKPGPNTIWIDLDSFAKTPSGHLLNLRNIISFDIFLQGTQPGDTVYLDRIFLSARKPSSNKGRSGSLWAWIKEMLQ